MSTLTVTKRSVVNKLKTVSLVNKIRYDLSTVQDETLKNILGLFMNTDETRFQLKKFFIDRNTLYYRTADTRMHFPKLVEHIIATKVDNNGKQLILGNSSVLPFLEAKSKVRLNTNQTEVQRILSTLVPMIPFSVFEQAKLDASKLIIVDTGEQETIKVKQNNPKFKSDKEVSEKNQEFIFTNRHYTGASLFKIGTEHFLFDIDRREIEHGIFNAFLVNLAKPAKTIASAYQGLKPKEVLEAEKKGLEVLRQGEWFFIPVSDAKSKSLNDLKGETELDDITLAAGPNRPNYTSGIELKDGKRLARRDMDWKERQNTKSDELYVTQSVQHSGREHEELKLKGWYTAVPNTATKSFTITGDVD